MLIGFHKKFYEIKLLAKGVNLIAPETIFLSKDTIFWKKCDY